jgi:aryl-alcohol dehydrogenase-like predicted oxidoreductase
MAWAVTLRTVSDGPRPAPPGGVFPLGGDLPVARLGYGAMRLTGQPGNWGPYRDPEGGVRLLRRAVELGVTLIDTADSYGPGHSEELIARALHPYPEGLVIATKVGMVRRGPGDIARDGRPEHLRAAAEESRRRLRVEAIDLLQLHRVDRRVPIEESVGALEDMRARGIVRHVGLSDVDEAELARARCVAPIASVQNAMSVASAGSGELVEGMAAAGIAFIAHSPLGGLGGRPLRAVAARRGATPRQVALAWLLARSPNLLPIPGTTSIAHLEENLGAAGLELTARDLAELAA